MLIRLIIYITIIYILYKIIKEAQRLRNEKRQDYKLKSTLSKQEDLVEDPFCHTYVPLSQAYKKEIYGIDYYFCSKQCSERYTNEKNN